MELETNEEQKMDILQTMLFTESKSLYQYTNMLDRLDALQTEINIMRSNMERSNG